MSDCPTEVSNKQLEDLFIRLAPRVS
jgi:hypothetical protein